MDNPKFVVKEKEYDFEDPYFNDVNESVEGGIKIKYPIVKRENLEEKLEELKNYSENYFKNTNPEDIYNSINKTNEYFANLSKEEKQELIEDLHKTSGFSKYDIENYGLNIFEVIKDIDLKEVSKIIENAFKRKETETKEGVIFSYGVLNPFSKWKEPKLITHFISGNVVGYTSLLLLIGMPVKEKGSAQVLKLPSHASLGSLLYAKKIGEIDPELRKTFAIGYWKGGDDNIEKVLIKNSDGINILGSKFAVDDLNARRKKYNPKSKFLGHGHKVGIAYISKEMVKDKKILEKIADELVKDIGVFSGGACYNTKNIYVESSDEEYKEFARLIFEKLQDFGKKSEMSKENLETGEMICEIYKGVPYVLRSKYGIVRIKDKPEFWIPDELYRYVQVMPVKDENELYKIIKPYKELLQTAVIAVKDEDIKRIGYLLGKAGISNVHYPGSAGILLSWEPHDGVYDYVAIRYDPGKRFTSINFKNNKTWLNE